MRKLLGLVFAALAATLFFALSAGQAFAGSVRCGDTIAQDTTLHSDLVNCPGDGLVVGAANITINLNGHKILGTGTGVGISNVGALPQRDPCTQCYPTAGFPGLTVKNGTVGGFATDIHAVGHQGTFRGLHVKGTLDAWGYGKFESQLTVGTQVLNSRVDGKAVYGSVKVGVNSVVRGNRIIGGNINLGGGTVDRNVIRPADGNLSVLQGKTYRSDSAGGPIIVAHNWLGGSVNLAGSSSAQVISNKIFGYLSASYQEQNTPGSLTIAANRIVSSLWDGIHVTGYWCTNIAHNRVIGSAANGILLAGGCVRQASPCTDVTDNRIIASGLDGIFATGSSSAACPLGRRFANNDLLRNHANGLNIGSGSMLVAVDSNTASRNGLDGIKLGSVNATVTANRAWSNSNLGIEALDGAQGSANSARRNGSAAQCVPALLCATGGTHGADPPNGLSPSSLGGQSAAVVAPPDTPTGFSGSGQDRTAILYWNAVAGASGYRVYLQQADGTWAARVVTTTTALFDPGLTNCATYTYSVAAFNSSDQESPLSTSLPITPTAPNQPC